MNREAARAPHTAGRVLHWAHCYDLLGHARFLRATRETLLELAAPAPGERALDVGCGTGVLALALASRAGSGSVCGIDASPEMIGVAKQKAAKAGAAVDFRIAPVEALPFADASFDLVTCSLVLHHLPPDVKRMGLAQVRRVLKPGGRFVAMDFAVHSHSALGHVLALLGHARGESTAAALTPMLHEARFGEVEQVPTRHKRFAFLRAR